MAKYRFTTSIFLTAIIIAGCASGSRAATSGVQGTAVVDAGCPVLEQSSACPQVVLRARIVVVQIDSGTQVSAVETAADGTFHIDLEPGAYELRGQNLSGAPVPTAMPVPVQVKPGEFTKVTVTFDSGIRVP